MGLVTALAALARAQKNRREFRAICSACGLLLDEAAHLDDLPALREVFVQRAYADWFPFGRRATIVDLGAHKGFFTLFAARYSGEGSTVLACEPEEENFRALEANVALHGLDDVTTMMVGVDAESGTATLHLGRSENHSLFSDHHRLLKRDASTEAVAVDVLSLKDLLDRAEVPEVDFLKLDCEGAEYPAILSADDATLRRAEVISLEFHDVDEPGSTGVDLARRIERAGFRIATFTHGPTWIDNNYGRLVAVR